MGLPEAGAEPQEEEEAVSLSEAGEEGEDQIDGEDVDETLLPPHLVTQAAPYKGTHHHGNIHQQTCKINTQAQALRTPSHSLLNTGCATRGLPLTMYELHRCRRVSNLHALFHCDASFYVSSIQHRIFHYIHLEIPS